MFTAMTQSNVDYKIFGEHRKKNIRWTVPFPPPFTPSKLNKIVRIDVRYLFQTLMKLLIYHRISEIGQLRDNEQSWLQPN